MQFQKRPGLIFYEASSGKLLWSFFENLFSMPIRVDQTTLHESEEIPHSRQKISYLNETIKHNQSNELDPSDYKHICHHD